MINKKQVYICPTCNSTKTILAHPTQSNEGFKQELPDSIFCGYRRCEDFALPIKNEENT